MGDAALIQGGRLGKTLERQTSCKKPLTDEATKAGYDSPQAYLNDLVDIETTDKGLIIKAKRQEPVTNIDYMEQRANEPPTSQPGQAWIIKLPLEKYQKQSPLQKLLKPRGAAEPATPATPDMVQTGTEPKGTRTTQPATEGRTEPPVAEERTREVFDNRLNNPEHQDYHG